MLIQLDQLPAQPNNSLIAGIGVLDHLVNVGRAIGSRELARQMGLTRTRANRLLGTLAFMGLVERDRDRKYRPGPGLHALAAKSLMATRLLPSAMPTLVALSAQGYTVALGTLWAGQVCYLFHERPGQSVAESVMHHELWPARNSSLGVALVAARLVEVDDRVVLPEGAQDTLLEGQELAVTVAAARKNGFAMLRFEDDVVSIGVTVGEPPMAGIAVSGRHLNDKAVPEIAQRLQSEARAIVERMHTDYKSSS